MTVEGNGRISFKNRMQMNTDKFCVIFIYPCFLFMLLGMYCRPF